MKTKDCCVRGTDSVAGGVSAALECGSLLPVLHISHGKAASKLAAGKSGSKLPHSKSGICEISTNEPEMSMKTKDNDKKWRS